MNEIKTTELARARALVSTKYNELRGVNAVFLGYVDPTGKASKSQGGIIIQINVRIKKYLDLDALVLEQAQMLCSLYVKLAKTIATGMKKHRLRAEIKGELWATIETYCPLIKDNGN
jgi:hypothetical protein